MSANTANLIDESVLSLLSVNNLIIPEIQREYVWGNTIDEKDEQRKVLENFLKNIKTKANICGTCHQPHDAEKINVGFLYSYKPRYAELEKGRFLDEYLIDGQQRITTIFLLLLVRAVKENRMPDFCTICRVHDDGYAESFNFKVRDLTQNFMNRLILHCKENGISSLNFVCEDDNPYWLLSDYENDPTVLAIKKTLKKILDVFDNDDEKYFDYILINIHFWHFKTEVTTQGEELYISMNSTGEQLSSNEIKKAEKLSTEKQSEWGAKWEAWQNLFWWNRSQNDDADAGFNNYLQCIESLHSYMNEDTLENKDIELYINALAYVTGKGYKTKKGGEDNLLNYCENNNLASSWLQDFRERVWETLNKGNEEWDVTTGKISDARNRKTMLFWPWMYLWRKYKASPNHEQQNDDTINEQCCGDLLRVIHMFYLRWYCEKRDYRKIIPAINMISEKGYTKALVSSEGEESRDETIDTGVSFDSDKCFEQEEILLETWYETYNAEKERTELENVIWKIQNIKDIRDGSYCGGHTVFSFKEQFKQDSMLKSAKTLLDFLNYASNHEANNLKSLILLYSENDDGKEKAFLFPKGGEKYITNEWKRIFRSSAFWRFYNDCSGIFPDNVDEKLKGKRDEFFSNLKIDYNSPLPLWEIVAIYDFLITDGSLLEHGIGYSNRDYDNFTPTMFNDYKDVYNLPRSFYMKQDYRVNINKQNWMEEIQTNYNNVEFLNYPQQKESN